MYNFEDPPHPWMISINKLVLGYFEDLDKILFKIIKENNCTIDDLNIYDFKVNYDFIAGDNIFSSRYIICLRGKQIREIHSYVNQRGYSIKQYFYDQQGQIVPYTPG